MEKLLVAVEIKVAAGVARLFDDKISLRLNYSAQAYFFIKATLLETRVIGCEPLKFGIQRHDLKLGTERLLNYSL